MRLSDELFEAAIVFLFDITESVLKEEVLFELFYPIKALMANVAGIVIVQLELEKL